MGKPSFYTLLGAKLGLGRIRSDRDLVALVELGLPADTIRSLLRGGLSAAEVHQLIVPRRTLARRVAGHEPLSREESDKAVRVARITAFAETVFGDPQRTWRWLRKPKTRFQGKTPIDMLATEAGARLVEEMAVQIYDGMTA